MLISQRLEQLAAQYDDSRRTISLYLLENPTSIEQLSMERIAQDTFTSKATLVRVAKQLGFSGWTEFSKQYLIEIERRRAHATNIDYNFPFRPGEPMRDIMHAITALRAESTYETERLQDPRDIERAAVALTRARHRALLGCSMSNVCLQLFRVKLWQIGFDAMMPTMDEIGRAALMLGEGDCALIVSYAGESAGRIPMRFIPLMRQAGATIIAVTGEGDSYLRRNADIVLPILSHEQLFNKIGNISTEASIGCILDMLYAGIFSLDYEHYLHFRTQAACRTEGCRRASNNQDDEVWG